MHVPLFTLCLQFALHILRPRPRRYAGLEDKSHTQKGREREKDSGGGDGEEKIWREERGVCWGANPLHSNAIMVCIWSWWGFVAAPLVLSLSVTLCTLAAKLIAIAVAISTVHDINMVAWRRQREAFKGT